MIKMKDNKDLESQAKLSKDLAMIGYMSSQSVYVSLKSNKIIQLDDNRKSDSFILKLINSHAELYNEPVDMFVFGLNMNGWVAGNVNIIGDESEDLIAFIQRLHDEPSINYRQSFLVVSIEKSGALRDLYISLLQEFVNSVYNRNFVVLIKSAEKFDFIKSEVVFLDGGHSFVENGNEVFFIK